VLESRWEMPNTHPSANRAEGRIAQRLMARRQQFPSIFISFPETSRFCLHLLNAKELWKILKMLRGSSPLFVLSNNTTFSQTQSGAIVPLKTCYCMIKHIFLLGYTSTHGECGLIKAIFN
jgi:hypothetical protein